MKKENLCLKYSLSAPKNGSVCVPSSAQKKQPTFLNKKHVLTYIFPKVIMFSHHNLSRQLSRRSGYYFIDIFAKETRMGVSMNEASSTPKAMKW